MRKSLWRLLILESMTLTGPHRHSSTSLFPTDMSSPATSVDISRSTPVHHSEYYFDDGNVVLLVCNYASYLLISGTHPMCT